MECCYIVSSVEGMVPTHTLVITYVSELQNATVISLLDLLG